MSVLVVAHGHGRIERVVHRIVARTSRGGKAGLYRMRAAPLSIVTSSTGATQGVKGGAR